MPESDIHKARSGLVIAYGEIPFPRSQAALAKAFDTDPVTASFDIYNPSYPFRNPPGLYQAVRVDGPDGRTNTIIFQHGRDGLIPCLDRIFDGLEDPVVWNLNGDIILRGVQVIKRSLDQKGQPTISFRTVDYRGPTIARLEPVFEGPPEMKDIREVRKTQGYQGIYTRPRHPGNEALGGDGQIGYTEVDSHPTLEKMPPSCLDVQHASIIYRFPKDTWGGVNDAEEIIEEGRFLRWHLLLIHEAYKTFTDAGGQLRHYAAGWLVHNPQTGEVIDPGVRITRSALPPGPWKGQDCSEDLKDVLYPTGFRLLSHEVAIIAAGASDARAYLLTTQNPLRLLETSPSKLAA